MMMTWIDAGHSCNVWSVGNDDRMGVDLTCLNKDGGVCYHLRIPHPTLLLPVMVNSCHACSVSNDDDVDDVDRRWSFL